MVPEQLFRVGLGQMRGSPQPHSPWALHPFPKVRQGPQETLRRGMAVWTPSRHCVMPGLYMGESPPCKRELLAQQQSKALQTRAREAPELDRQDRALLICSLCQSPRRQRQRNGGCPARRGAGVQYPILGRSPSSEVRSWWQSRTVEVSFRQRNLPLQVGHKAEN